MIPQIRKVVGMVYEMFFLPAILDQVDSGVQTVAASADVSMPIGREFKLPSGARMLRVQLELTGTRRTGSSCRCMHSTHLDDDLSAFRQKLRDTMSEGGSEEAFLAGTPVRLSVTLDDAKYDNVELAPCTVLCTLTIIDTTK